MVKAWRIVLDGVERRLEVSWDTLGSGAGRFCLDGSEVGRWGWGIKWPGVKRSTTVSGHTLTVVQRLRDFDLLVDGCPAVGARPVAPSRRERGTVLWIAVVLIVMSVILVLIVAILERG